MGRICGEAQCFLSSAPGPKQTEAPTEEEKSSNRGAQRVSQATGNIRISERTHFDMKSAQLIIRHFSREYPTAKLSRRNLLHGVAICDWKFSESGDRPQAMQMHKLFSSHCASGQSLWRPQALKLRPQ
uniref:Uncharacterized protein n=1 Tax=Rhodosorus marinus TaxID=101924 RepID=A0A7S2ZR31_9RHOD